jgi:hypothetical protein
MDNPSTQANALPKMDAWGRPKVILDRSLFHALFTYDIPKRLFRTLENDVEVTSSTAATSVDGMLKMNSAGLTSVEVSSYRHPRYQPNRGILYSSSWIFPNWQNDATTEVGLFNGSQSGLFFRIRSGKVHAVRRSLGVDYAEEIALPAGADLTKGSLYDIQGQWRGVGSFFFFITHNKGTTIHTMSLLGTRDAVTIDNPAMKIAMKITNHTQSAIAYCGCIDYSSEGGINERLQYGSTYVLDKSVSAGAGLFAIRSPLLINGLPNTRDTQLARITVQADKKSDFSLYYTRNAAAVTATGWTAINNGSYLESTSTITATNVALAQFVSVFTLAANDQVTRDNPFPEKIDFYITAGDTMFFRCASGTGVSTTCIVEVGEEV